MPEKSLPANKTPTALAHDGTIPMTLSRSLAVPPVLDGTFNRTRDCPGIIEMNSVFDPILSRDQKRGINFRFCRPFAGASCLGRSVVIHGSSVPPAVGERHTNRVNPDAAIAFSVQQRKVNVRHEFPLALALRYRPL